jgi:hypothetical protein
MDSKPCDGGLRGIKKGQAEEEEKDSRCLLERTADQENSGPAVPATEGLSTTAPNKLPRDISNQGVGRQMAGTGQ